MERDILKNLHYLGVKDISALRYRNIPPPTEIPKDIKIFNDFEDALNSKPEIVIVANPTSMHYEYALKALKESCHVYIEKPLSDKDSGLNILQEIQIENNNVVQIGCQLRFHPHLIKIKELIKSKKLGSIHSVVADVGEHLPNWHPWEDYTKSYASRKDQGVESSLQ